jgi:serine/threonine protein phosphatase 1
MTMDDNSVENAGKANPFMLKTFMRASAIDGQLVYAIGDIHGCYVQLTLLLKAIVSDAAERSRGREPIVIFAGDYVDRGPESARVLDALCWLDRNRPYEVHFLRGNHEKAFRDYIRDPRQSIGWLRVGGRETLQSYGIQPPDEDARLADHIRARDDLLQVLPIAHLMLLDNLETMITIGDYVFVHAGIRAMLKLSDQREEDLIWIREEFISYKGPHEKIVVHGHTWKDSNPDIQRYRIGIDTGAYETGVLTAIRIEDGEIEFLQAKLPS